MCKYLISKEHTAEHNDFLHHTRKDELFAISSQEEAMKILAEVYRWDTMEDIEC